MFSKKFAVGLAAAAALTLPFLLATPALAATPATLPATDKLWAISCDFADTHDGATLYSVDPTTAAGTPVGTTTGVQDECAGQAAFDPTTGNSYYISWADDGTLGMIDLTTGLTTTIPWAGSHVHDEPDSMAIGLDGKGYVIKGNTLYALDLSTHVLTAVGDLGDNGFYGFSVDPTTGLFYAMSGSGEAYELTITTGDTPAVTVTYIGSALAGVSRMYSLQIDSAGLWWIQANLVSGGPTQAQIWSGTRPAAQADTQFTLAGTYTDSATARNPYFESLLITIVKPTPDPAPEPVLAATGTDSTLVAGTAGAALLLMIAGSAALVLRRRTRVTD
jgi:LPXTG-motif cell wall-anchored protein